MELKVEIWYLDYFRNGKFDGGVEILILSKIGPTSDITVSLKVQKRVMLITSQQNGMKS